MRTQRPNRYRLTSRRGERIAIAFALGGAVLGATPTCNQVLREVVSSLSISRGLFDSVRMPFGQPLESLADRVGREISVHRSGER